LAFQWLWFNLVKTKDKAIFLAFCYLK